MPLQSSEIRAVKSLLHRSRELLEDACDITGAASVDQTRRLKEISHRITDEINEAERALGAAERLEGGSGK
jgi:hypothetical protein